MRSQTPLSLALYLLAGAAQAQNTAKPAGQSSRQCRCVPGESCWPSDDSWIKFNSTVGGKLIKSVPVAQSCYEGPTQDAKQCKDVNNLWADDDFQTEQPLGRFYPYNTTCPPDISETLQFAQDHDIRVSVVNTGHDLNARIDGFGSLAIWMRNYRNAIEFQGTFQSATQCTQSGWTGHAIHVDGVYQCGDVHKVAQDHNVIIVGGGASSVGANGGWLSGGGHGPASRNYGLGADQLLEADVMLADGRIVIANHCQNADLFRALRGGGPGYGIVLGTKIKAYPNVNVITAHHLTITPQATTDENADLLDAISIMMQSFPDLNEGGYAGLWTIGKGKAEADAIFTRVREKLSQFKGKLVIHEDFKEYDDYWSFYEGELDRGDFPGDTLLLTSRLLNKEAVQDYDSVRHTVEIVSGKPEEYTMNLVMLVSGGKVFEDAADTSSGLHPAWRNSSMVLLTARRISKSQTLTAADRQAMADDITFTKGAATKRLAPDTGGYMNEGDPNDPYYKTTFYGDNYESHRAAKNKYDPNYVFYCPSCVGAEEFIDRPDGALCKK
ncbi:FAD binding domain-containing protein [Hirsutella rhossiliensis]|uniref:FAD binding domain-containing protein n=1 Tax=Hirsutella rhossiliensis TaxID=111463 RepID=A0A9P8SEQ4_9HYPO|nr:FAD binding domain-containing protein [Hirsutella rhossiliensis]KAH0958610.1 FAD binding domain-containing protein [Hirsutella rhossiliensis]